jgi:hypothetical protein
MHPSSCLRLAGLALGALVTGCSSYRSPAIQVQNVRVVDQTDEAITLGFDLAVTNPNDEPLKLLDFNYSLTVDGKGVYSGKRSAEATLNAAGEQRVTLPAVVPFQRTGWQPGSVPAQADYAISGSVLFLTPGEIALILFDSGVRRPKARFAQAGVAPLGTGTR